MGVSNIWTPRRTTKLWPRKPGYQRHPFTPEIGPQPYVVPAQPSALKKPPPEREALVPSGELAQSADELREEAMGLESQIRVHAVPLRIQLGQMLNSKEDFLKKTLKDWIKPGKNDLGVIEVPPEEFERDPASKKK